MQAPPCPRCQEFRLTEVITTKQRREAFCRVCSFAWRFEADVCHCDIGPHLIDLCYPENYPPCPRCGGRARMTVPV